MNAPLTVLGPDFPFAYGDWLAHPAGLGALQHFLESGFDTFGELARQRGAVERFLDTVHERESHLMQIMFEAPSVACETELTRTLGQAR